MVAPFCEHGQLSNTKRKLSKLLLALQLCIAMLTGCGTDDLIQFVEPSLVIQQTEQIPSDSVKIGDPQQGSFDLLQIPESDRGLCAADSNYVLYRVTPVFECDNLPTSGVLMEGYAVIRILLPLF